MMLAGPLLGPIGPWSALSDLRCLRTDEQHSAVLTKGSLVSAAECWSSANEHPTNPMQGGTRVNRDDWATIRPRLVLSRESWAVGWVGWAREIPFWAQFGPAGLLGPTRAQLGPMGVFLGPLSPFLGTV